MLNAMKYISTVPFSGLFNWDVKIILGDNIISSKKHPMKTFSYFTRSANIQKVKIEDEQEYKILGVRSYGLGAYKNRITKGKYLKMKVYQQAKLNHLFWCKVDTKNGAFGIISQELSDGIASSNMMFAELDLSRINPDYLQLLFRCPKINTYMDSMVTGTTNRKYIRFSDLLNNVKVPVPSLEEQNELVKEYNKQISLARNLGEKARQEELDIHAYILSKLGVKLPNHKLSQKAKNRELISFVNYKDVDRWDMWSKEQYIHSLLNQSIYKSVQLGALDFVGRSWKKDSESFRYIEMSDVDPIFGIVNDTIISTKDAPSRATQSVNTGDLIIGTTRPYLKRFAIVTSEHDNCICSSAFQVIKPNKNYNLEYVYYFLRTQLAIMQFEAFMTGALYPAINTSDLGRIKIILPPLSVQESIAQYANKKTAKVQQAISQSRTGFVEALKTFETQIFE